MTREINADELEKLIEETKILIVDFSAVWCGPCKSLGKTLEKKVEPKLEEMDDVDIVKIDIDKNRELAQSLNIKGVPTMMFFVEGKKVVFDTDRGQEDRIVGALPNIDEVIFKFIEETKKNL